MPRSAFMGACLMLVALYELGTLHPAARAQDVSNDRRSGPLATLPQSNEALLLTSRVERALQVGDYRLAVELVEQMLRLQGGLVAAPASRTFYPVWRQAQLLMSRFPPPGVELYRRLRDAEVRSRFEDARRRSEIATLATLFRSTRLSSVWPEIGDELAAQYMERGRFGEAIEVLREMESAGQRPTPVRQARLVVALAGVGAWQAARRQFQELERSVSQAAGGHAYARLDELRRWLSARHQGEVGAAADATPYALQSHLFWSVDLGSGQTPTMMDKDVDVANAIMNLQQLPLHEPVLRDGVLVVRMRGVLHVLDALTLVQRWQATEFSTEGLRLGWGDAGADDAQSEVPVSPETRLLLSNQLRHTASVGPRDVYTIESLTLSNEQDVFPQRGFAVAHATAHRNELVARDLRTGHVVWRTGEDASHPLFDAEFQDRPLVLGARLVVPVRVGEDLVLAELDADNGELLREVRVIGPPTYFTPQGGRCVITADETSVYLVTGNGVVAALARDDLEWKWATSYPSTLPEHLGRLWWKPPVKPRESGIDRPILTDELLVAAPIDSVEIIAFDRFSGRVRWRMPRQGSSFLVGAVTRGVLIGRDAIVCLDPMDPSGRPPQWQSVPLPIVGRPAVQNDVVFVPTRDGLVVLDGVTGKVIQDQYDLLAERQRGFQPFDGDEALAAGAHATAPTLAANLAVTTEAVFCVSPNHIVKFPNPARTRQICEQRLAREAGDPAAHLALAWLDALAGRYEAARRRLEPDGFVWGPQQDSRDRILVQTYLALASETEAVAERLTWLRRAAQLVRAADVEARLAVQIGIALEQQQRWGEALRHYGRLLDAPQTAVVATGEGPDSRVGIWVVALRRIRRQVERIVDRPRPEQAPADVRDALEDFVKQFARDPDTPYVALLRLRPALTGSNAQKWVDRAVLRRDAPPALAASVLPTLEASDGPSDEEQRALDLARWEIMVALDRRDEARAARDRWVSRYGAESDDVPAAQRDRIAGVELSQRKLEALRAEPFSEQVWRQWRIPNAELLLDARRGRPPMPRWVLVRDHETREIQLINLAQHQFAQFKVPDVVRGTAPASLRLQEIQERLLRGRHDWGDTDRRFWPMVQTDTLAAIPTQGGLICVGLGAELGGGGRLWEYPIPEWTTVPENFAETAVAGPHGVYFTPRPDRVAFVGWADGALWWQLDLSGTNVRRLDLAGDRLVITSSDQRAWVTDALYGGRPEELQTDPASLRGVRTTGDRIIAWGEDFVAAFDADTLERVWVRAGRPGLSTGDGAAGVVPIAERNWLAVRQTDSSWRVLAIDDGSPVFPSPLEGISKIEAAAVRDGALLVAGAPSSDETANTQRVVIASYDVGRGALRWRSVLDTRVPVNVSQLLGHPEYIPVLLHRAEAADEDDAGDRAVQVQLLRVDDGTALEPRPIRGEYEPATAGCDMHMIVTPARIVVQVEGNTLAYGNSSHSREP